MRLGAGSVFLVSVLAACGGGGGTGHGLGVASQSVVTGSNTGGTVDLDPPLSAIGANGLAYATSDTGYDDMVDTEITVPMVVSILSSDRDEDAVFTDVITLRAGASDGQRFQYYLMDLTLTLEEETYRFTELNDQQNRNETADGRLYAKFGGGSLRLLGRHNGDYVVGHAYVGHMTNPAYLSQLSGTATYSSGLRSFETYGNIFRADGIQINDIDGKHQNMNGEVTFTANFDNSTIDGHVLIGEMYAFDGDDERSRRLFLDFEGPIEGNGFTSDMNARCPESDVVCSGGGSMAANFYEADGSYFAGVTEIDVTMEVGGDASGATTYRGSGLIRSVARD